MNNRTNEELGQDIVYGIAKGLKVLAWIVVSAIVICIVVFSNARSFM